MLSFVQVVNLYNVTTEGLYKIHWFYSKYILCLHEYRRASKGGLKTYEVCVVKVFGGWVNDGETVQIIKSAHRSGQLQCLHPQAPF